MTTQTQTQAEAPTPVIELDAYGQTLDSERKAKRAADDLMAATLQTRAGRGIILDAGHVREVSPEFAHSLFSKVAAWGFADRVEIENAKTSVEKTLEEGLETEAEKANEGPAEPKTDKDAQTAWGPWRLSA